MRNLILLIAILIAFASVSHAQGPQTKNTLKLNPAEKGGAATISDMAWLSGTWHGTFMGGSTEEVWSKPRGGVMIGMFRFLMDEKPIFYELMTLSEINGGVILRLKHFHANFVAWEEKDKTVDFRFIKQVGNRIYFDGLTFERKGKNEIGLYILIGNKDGSVKEESATYKRVKQ